ncbi:MAG TPA: hypothetical protein VLA15_10895 [Desulfurivibrionaceae bacterium]|nr:hypothetical protein [Desulfurivibrionaceae bacterium]
MNKAIEGALLSGLVLPGLGQLFLKHYWRGAVLLLASLGCLAVLVAKGVEQATAVIGRLELVGGALDPVALLAEINRAAATSSGVAFRVASLLILLFWLGGTVDAYLLGRKLDLAERQARQGG